MSSTRSNLKLDERSFEALLAAAYTVQEHTAQKKPAPGLELVCAQCGTTFEPLHQFCGMCGAPREQFRPGERMQRKWASLWLMSQQGQRPMQPPFSPDGIKIGHPQHPYPNGDGVSDGILAAPHSFVGTPKSQPEISESGWSAETLFPANSVLVDEEYNETSSADVLLLDDTDLAQAPSTEAPQHGGLHLTLRFLRADLYLALAILVSVFAMAWVIWAAPVTRSGVGRPRLPLWERALVKMGIVEASVAPPVYRGDPTVKVWADPHTALYYCYGAEQFGTTSDGHFSTQREAQMDHFSPAARTPCE